MGGSALVSFDDLDIEALTEAAKEAFEEVTWSLEKTLTHATNFGRILSSVRKKIPHGEWSGWVQNTFGDTMSLRKIQRYMQIANASDQTLLEGAKTIDEALERIAEPKRERKPSVEVIEPKKPEEKPEPTGEKATLAVSREETRKAPPHRAPEKFTPVTPSYDDEDDSEEQEQEEVIPMRLESGFDDVEATERIRSFIRKEISRWPSDRRAEAIQVFNLYLGDFDNE